ncbi:hypothetical protein D3C72_1769020 [compost metagenome]
MPEFYPRPWDETCAICKGFADRKGSCLKYTCAGAHIPDETLAQFRERIKETK